MKGDSQADRASSREHSKEQSSSSQAKVNVALVWDVSGSGADDMMT